MPVTEREQKSPEVDLEQALGFLGPTQRKELINKFGSTPTQEGLDPETIVAAVARMTEIAKEAKISGFLMPLTERALSEAYREKFGHGIASGLPQETTHSPNGKVTGAKRLREVFSRVARGKSGK